MSHQMKQPSQSVSKSKCSHCSSRCGDISSFHNIVSQPSIISQSFEPDFIVIHWEQDSTIKSYKIQYNFTIRECADEMARQVTNNYELSEIMERNNYTINSTNVPVEEDSDYNISLIAVNSNVSSPAAVIIGTTKEAGIRMCMCSCKTNFNLLNIPAPSGAPMSITNTSNSATSITITWDRVACSQRNGGIDGYNVTYYPNADYTKKVTSTVYGVTDSNRTFLASGLQPLTNYTFEVQAFNGDMYGPAANVTFQTSGTSYMSMVTVIACIVML